MGFKKIFLGIIFLFDFRFNGIDIIPDFIGFILIFLGLSEICKLHEKFNTAKTLSLVLIFISIPDIYNSPTTYTSAQEALANVNPLLFLFGIVYTILYLFFMYYLFTGIRDVAMERNNNILANRANLTWILVFINSIGTYLIFILFFPLLVILLILFSIFVFILQLMTVYLAMETINDNNYDKY